MGTELDLDDVAAQSDLATTELMELRGQRDELLNIVKRLVNDGLSTSLVKDARSVIDNIA